MGQQAILRFHGHLQTGLQVTLNIRDEQGQELTEANGTLPPAPELAQSIDQWQDSYRQSMAAASQMNWRITVEEVTVEPGALAKQELCRQRGEQLQQQFTKWLNRSEFRPIDQCLRENFTHEDNIRILLRSDELLLHRLPWHCWDFIDHYPLAELTFGSMPYRIPPQQIARRSKGKVRILAILGDRRNIDTDVDRKLLEALPNTDVTFLVEPTRQQMDSRLWERQSWDVLFFAGHSASDANQGVIYLNPQDCLTLKELRYGLRRAIRRGLQLAIFNSCDGLGLAHALGPLHLPNLIVMREPVADRVAQDFLKYFLTALSSGDALHIALREARERLQSLEDQFLWATWLPVLLQNPATLPPTWQSLKDPPSPPLKWQALIRTAVLGAGLGLALIAGRYSGGLQALELAIHDHFIRSRPSEQLDDRIVVVEITDDDIANQPKAEREEWAPGQFRSISNQALDEVFKRLERDYNPAVIGLDVYRDLPSDIPSLAAQYANNDRLIAVCKGGSNEIQSIAPPAEVPIQRQALSDTIDDPDGVVRRQLISSDDPYTGSPCRSIHTLSTALAQQYLSTVEGVELDLAQLPQIGGLMTGLNHLTFAPHGPYAPINVQGHQMFLNYRVHHSERGQPKDPALTFDHVTLAKLRAGEVNPEALENKIVLIGVNASSSDDYWLTPYRDEAGQPLEVAGVYMQAQMTSQLISAALDGRSLLYRLPWLVEGFTLLAVGATTAVFVRGRREWIVLAIAIPGLYGISWLIFTIGGLGLPLLPWSLAAVGGGLMNYIDRRFIQ